MKKYRKIIIISLCAVLLIGTFVMLNSSVAAETTLPNGGSLEDDYTLNGNMTITSALNVDTGKSAIITGVGLLKFGDVNFTVDGELTIRGNSAADRIIIDGQSLDRVLFNDRGSLTLENVTIQNVGSDQPGSGMHGGAIKVESDRDSASLSLNNVTIDNCKAAEGGAVYIGNCPNATVEIENSTISNCSSIAEADNASYKYYGGGAICVRNQNAQGESSITLTNTKIENCTATQGGGAICIRKGWSNSADTDTAPTTLTLDNSQIKNCQAREGGGIHIEGKAVVDLDVINNSVISGCKTTEVSNSYRNEYGGGGLNVRNSNAGSTYTFENSTVENCDSYWNGGGIRLCGEVPAGAVTSLSGCVLSGNAAGNGSAILLHGPGNGTVNISKCIFDANVTRYKRTDSSEGDSQNYGGTLRAGWDGKWVATVSDCVFRNNQSTMAGGAIYWNQTMGGSIRVEDCHCYDNTANNYGGGDTYGGALFFEAINTTVIGTEMPTKLFDGGIEELRASGLTGTYISGNYAMYGGGVAYKSVGSRENVEHGELTLRENVLIENNSAERGGGFAFLVKQAEQSSGASNIASKATFSANIEGAAIRNNSATEYGGGVYISKWMTEPFHTACSLIVTLKSGSIENNTATIDGGGVYIMGYVRTKKGSNELSDNNYEPTIDGGFTGSSTFEMTGGTVKGNATEIGSGGGVHIEKGSVIVTGGTISDNTAKTIGGGINVAGGSVTVGDSGCQTAYQSTHVHPVITNNTASTRGGGIDVEGGSVTMYCGDVINNTATDSSSSNNVYVDAGGSFTIENGYLGIGVEGNITDYRQQIDVIYCDNFSAGNNNVTISGKLAGGAEFDPYTLYGGETDAVASINAMKIREGYVFLGWSTSSRATNENFAPVSGGTLVAGQGDTYVYAVWEPESRHISFKTLGYPNEDHLTVFHIKSTSLALAELSPITLDVIVKGNATVSVLLPKGTYTVTVQKDWRYGSDATELSPVTVTDSDQTVTVTIGEAVNEKWLNKWTVIDGQTNIYVNNDEDIFGEILSADSE